MLKFSKILHFFAIAFLAFTLTQVCSAVPKANYVVASPSTISVGDPTTITAYISLSGGEIWQGGVVVIYATPPGGSESSVGALDSSSFSGNSSSMSFTPSSSGVWKFRAEMQGGYFNPASGQSGGVDTTRTSYKSVTVNASTSGSSPTVSLFTGSPKSPYVGDEILLSATVNDSDGTIDHVKFKIGNTVIATDYTPPYTCSYTKNTYGTVNFTATVQDNSGLHGNKTESVKWINKPLTTELYGGDRWVDANGDGLLDFVVDVVKTDKSQNAFENYFYGAPSVGSNGGLIFNDFDYAEHCYYYYTPIFNYLSDFIWEPWGFFGDRWSWVGSWWAPSVQYDCDYQVISVSSRFEFHASEPGVEYQVQKSDSATNQGWGNVGGPILATVNAISRQIGEWGGVRYVPAFVRMVALSKPGGLGFTDREIGDVDGDGKNDVERIIKKPEVVSVIDTGIIESTTGAVKKILSVNIPVGVTINPTGSGKTVNIKVKSIGEVVFEKTVEFVITDELSAIVIGIEGLEGSKIEVTMTFPSGEFDFDLRSEQYSGFPNGPEMMGDPWEYGLFMSGLQEDLIGVQLPVNNNFQGVSNSVPDSHAFRESHKVVDGDLDIVTADINISGVESITTGKMRLSLVNNSQGESGMVRVWRDGLNRSLTNYLIGSGPSSDLNATDATANIRVLSVPAGTRSSVKEWNMNSSFERNDFVNLATEGALFLEGVKSGAGHLLLEYLNNEDEVVHEDSILINVLNSRTVGIRIGLASSGLDISRATRNSNNIRYHDGRRGVILKDDVVIPIAFSELSKRVLPSNNYHDITSENVPCGDDQPQYSGALNFARIQNIDVMVVNSIAGGVSHGFSRLPQYVDGIPVEFFPEIVVVNMTPENVLSHEYGHTLGLLHQNDGDNFMTGAGLLDNNCHPAWPLPSGQTYRYATESQRDVLLDYD